MGFTKLDEGILQSSIMAEAPATFKVWIAILASCNYDGVARVSSVFLSSACHLSLAITDRAIEALSNPDPRSRSLIDDGRRIRRVDGGYFVINYEKYRAFTPNDGDPNSPGALRTRRWRERKGQDVTNPPVVTHGDACDVTSASASSSEDKTRREDKTRGVTAGVAEIVTYLNSVTGKRFSLKSSDTAKHIGARLNEGRTIEDFKRVIDTKVAKWHGKTWADSRPGRDGQTVHGDDFLCPSTLFCAKNFENYLNETPAAKKMTTEEWRAQQAAELKKLRGEA